ncbi:MAG: hypothetical protein GY795_36505 [Desulfobacterales bacterium]|nr:hypothetical protein [Desulfobacterales bacterium]
MNGESEIQKVQEYLNKVGVFPKVPATVTLINSYDKAVFLRVSLNYLKEHPVCCGEPVCYIPFLTIDGLKRLAELFQKERNLSSVPQLTIRVDCIFEPGFEFLEKGLGEAKNWSTIYNYPEMEMISKEKF